MCENHPCICYLYVIHIGGIGLCGDLMGNSYSEYYGIPGALVGTHCCPLHVHWPWMCLEYVVVLQCWCVCVCVEGRGSSEVAAKVCIMLWMR